MNDELRQKVRERDDHKCRFCEDEENLHTHHIIPRSAGGSDDKDNLMTVCQACHNTIESTQGKALKRLRKNLKERIFDKIEEDAVVEKQIHLTRTTQLAADNIWYIGNNLEQAVDKYKEKEKAEILKYSVEINLEVEDIKQAVTQALPSGSFE